jgi:hypothetical protein
MVVTAGHVMLAQEFAQYVTESTDITSANTATTTETVATSVTWTAFAGVRYKVTLRMATESSSAGDAITVRMRWQNSGSPGTGGTEFAKINAYAEAANHSDGRTNLHGTFNSQTAGALTVSATIVRGPAAAGTVKCNCVASAAYFLVEIIGPA